MAVHYDTNSQKLKLKEIPALDNPDSLQDLCKFYLMNNINTLATSINSLNDVKNDWTSTFSFLLGNKLLEYYLKCCIPDKGELHYLDKFLEKNQSCDEINITRQTVLNEVNVRKLASACKSLKKLHLTCFESDVFSSLKYVAFKLLLENNLSHLTCVSLSQKCEEATTLGLLNVLCGRDYDADVRELVLEDDDDDESVEEAADDDTEKPEDDCTRKLEDDDVGKLSDEESKSSGSKIKLEDTHTATETASVEMDVNESEIRSDIVISDLKSFSYRQIYTSAHPNLQPCSYFGWFYNLMSRIVSCNKHLQSFTLVTLISNPIEWFLSQPELALLKDLQSLCLSFQYCDCYSAESDEIVRPKMPYTKNFFENLPVLQHLRHLDISCNIPDEILIEGPGFAYSSKEVDMFREAIKELPHLKSLDISGTNLASIICHKNKGEEKCFDHCMPGFEGRQFDFLGLYGTDACRHKFIPADRVSGNASIEQLSEALQTLQHNLLIIPMVVKEIYQWIGEHSVNSRTGLALIDGLIAYLIKLGEWSGSYSEAQSFEEQTVSVALESIKILTSQDDIKLCMTIKRKRVLLEQLLVVCHNVNTEGEWDRSVGQQRNKIYLTAMLLIRDLELQYIAVYSYRFNQCIQVLIGILDSPSDDTLIHVCVLLSLLCLLQSACIVSQEYIAVAGTKLGLVKKLLKTMKRLKISDDISIEKNAWSIIWTLTDGVLSNCEAFVQNEGCEIAKGCIQKYPEEEVPFRTIAATLGNVAENSSLTKYLMRSDFLIVFRQLLHYKSEVNCVSYHAAKFFIMLASQGPEAWTVAKPSRDDVLEEIDSIMKKWDIPIPTEVEFVDLEKSIGRSFTVALSQIDNYSTPVAQIWAAWNICHMIRVTPHHYCDMLERENGLTKIDRVLQHEGLRDDLVALLEKIKSLTLEFKQRRVRQHVMDVCRN